MSDKAAGDTEKDKTDKAKKIANDDRDRETKAKEQKEIDAALADMKGSLGGGAGSLSAAQIAEFQEIFNLVDEDRGGTIGVSEMLNLAKIMKMEATEEEIEELVYQEGGDDGQISFDEFVHSLTTIPKVSYSTDEVKEAFCRLAGCRANPGHIQVTELLHAFTCYGDGMSEDMANEMLAKVEVKKDGTFNYDEYVALMMNGPGDDAAAPDAPAAGGDDAT